LVWLACLGVIFQAQAQQVDKIEDLKAKEQALKLNSKLVKLKIDLEEEKTRNADLKTKADNYNYKSTMGVPSYDSNDAVASAKAAKKTSQMLKKTEQANKKLSESNKKIEDLEKDIRKNKSKVDKLEKKVRFVEPEKH